jgi:hypothetical protein
MHGSCPRCNSSSTEGFRQYDTQRPGLRFCGAGEKCRDCGAWWKVGEWVEYPPELKGGESESFRERMDREHANQPGSTSFGFNARAHPHSGASDD